MISCWEANSWEDRVPALVYTRLGTNLPTVVLIVNPRPLYFSSASDKLHGIPVFHLITAKATLINYNFIPGNAAFREVLRTT
jgi:hypothetical protein